MECTGTIPSPRSDMSIIQREGLVYLFGGSEDQQGSNELFSLNLNKSKINITKRDEVREIDNEWKQIQVKNEYPCERWGHSMIPYEDGIFVIGGENQDGRVLDLFYLNLGKLFLPFETIKVEQSLCTKRRSSVPI